MLKLDHFCLFAPNHYKAAFDLSAETGLRHYDGGFFPKAGIGTKIFPLAADLFIEVEGFVDMSIARALWRSKSSVASWLNRPEFFAGWCFRAESEDELRAFADLRGISVDTTSLDADNAQQMMNGEKVILSLAPTAADAWPAGQPNVYFWPDMLKHDARYPTDPHTGRFDGQGLAWIEVGGTVENFDAYFCGMTTAAEHPIRFNGQSPGLYAVAVNTPAGEKVIRRPSISG
ncbi:VOC family protein [Rhizorhabdus dicambivorans]|uniref:Glyoxalase-like domain-containing protein n=1 Tax=Rhizorhabdus dicambivorans TaxID=1850238 RepID=A0A2A4FRY3_9SPHN|nr:VOC family protein [Rhizorhabdus dicambivorans]ATE66306.1 hypothetical protein CMV14_19460 [Rhizorhabdus dicambivorans]PCE40161.1 hypothetical protein COO09_21895 [Rhizorhabdus dicambivorans]